MKTRRAVHLQPAHPVVMQMLVCHPEAMERIRGKVRATEGMLPTAGDVMRC